MENFKTPCQREPDPSPRRRWRREGTEVACSGRVSFVQMYIAEQRLNSNSDWGQVCPAQREGGQKGGGVRPLAISRWLSLHCDSPSLQSLALCTVCWWAQAWYVYIQYLSPQQELISSFTGACKCMATWTYSIKRTSVGGTRRCLPSKPRGALETRKGKNWELVSDLRQMCSLWHKNFVHHNWQSLVSQSEDSWTTEHRSTSRRHSGARQA